MIMNVSERRALRRAKTLLIAGDRSRALAIVRSLEEAPRVSFSAQAAQQLMFAFVTFRCARLNADDVPVHTCVTRQVVTDLQRSRQVSRGQGSDYPSCDSRSCDQGRSIRGRLDPSTPIAWQGAGPGGRFERERSRGLFAVQEAARTKLDRVGLLAQASTVDQVSTNEGEG